MTKTSLITVIAALLISSASTAGAATSDDTAQIKVSTAGLNLNSAAGAQALQDRIHAGAVSYCGPAPYIGDLRAGHNWKVCVDAATDRLAKAMKTATPTMAYQTSPTASR